MNTNGSLPLPQMGLGPPGSEGGQGHSCGHAPAGHGASWRVAGAGPLTVTLVFQAGLREPPFAQAPGCPRIPFGRAKEL